MNFNSFIYSLNINRFEKKKAPILFYYPLNNEIFLFTYSDSRRSTESIEEQEGSKDMLYEPMSSTSDDGGRGSIGSMEGIYQHPRRRRSSRFGSVSSLNSEVGIQIVGNGLKEITFYDVKLLVPDNATLTLVQDSIEIRTDRSICKIEKDVSNTTHNTKL